ncbi:MAG TPA: D-hexose-6-phosphate mutarotase [Candidatus Acidoferrum sp.]|nr:D-hexose-6-phosphate mutarotase [Candidatus Acidoferrum sp.]
MGTRTPALDHLQDRFAIPGVVRFEQGPGGLTRVVVDTPRSEAHVYLHAAHVTHYQPRGDRPVLFMSQRSWFEPGAPIRGGVPIVFPWFGPKAGEPSAPMHGFARLAEWTVESVSQTPDGSVRLVLGLEAEATTHPSWPHACSLQYRVVIGEELDLALEVCNRSDAAIIFEEALHTYLTVGDARQISVAGLAGSRYIDKTDGMRRKVQEPELLRIAGETDRVYLGTHATCIVEDPVAGRHLRVEKSGSEATVVWNPWIAKAKAMPDFGDDEWLRMLCIESGNVADHAVTLAPGQRHEMRVSIHSTPR